jgi:fatty-acyl-CoA synthase
MTRQALFPPGIQPGIFLGDPLEIVAKHFPNQTAIVIGNIRKTWNEFFVDVQRVSSGLIDLGINKNDNISIWAKNNYEWTISWFAIARIGAVIVPLDHWYRDEDASYILNHSEAKAVICSEDYIPLLYQMNTFPHLKYIITMNTPKEDYTKSFGKEKPYILSYFQSFLNTTFSDEMAKRLELRSKEMDPDDTVFILYTSGTTGRPKGAMLTHNNIIRNVIEVAKALCTTNEDAFLIPVPFSHCFGCVLGIMTAIVTGAKMVPMQDQTPNLALKAITEEKCSIIHGTPTHFIRYIAEAKAHPELYDLSSLQSGIVAGSACPLPVMDGIVNDLNLKYITNGYGMTETSPIITITRPSDPVEKRRTTVGKALDGLEVRIVDEHNREVPHHTDGELVCRGWNVMKGYYKDPQATANAIDEFGYMHTGDLAQQDDEGYYQITGRIKDMIIYGGANVYPKIIEDFLLAHSEIYEAAVVGASDDIYGEVVACAAQVKPGFTEQQLVDLCYGKLNDFSVPRYVRFDIPIPLSGRGKIQKYKLRNTFNELKKEGKLIKYIPTEVKKKKMNTQ